MMSSFLPATGDRVLAFMLPLLMVATLAVAAEAHALCSFFCVHGDRMPATEICASQN